MWHWCILYNIWRSLLLLCKSFSDIIYLWIRLLNQKLRKCGKSEFFTSTLLKEIKITPLIPLTNGLIVLNFFARHFIDTDTKVNFIYIILLFIFPFFIRVLFPLISISFLSTYIFFLYLLDVHIYWKTKKKELFKVSDFHFIHSLVSQLTLSGNRNLSLYTNDFMYKKY